MQIRCILVAIKTAVGPFFGRYRCLVFLNSAPEAHLTLEVRLLVRAPFSESSLNE